MLGDHRSLTTIDNLALTVRGQDSSNKNDFKTSRKSDSSIINVKLTGNFMANPQTGKRR